MEASIFVNKEYTIMSIKSKKDKNIPASTEIEVEFSGDYVTCTAIYKLESLSSTPQ